ncbi:hypothetical protein G6F37_000054 [Rhizopus arrhizus]|nr:hypothetical protein G6F37_000054 [Rhizopus arrhizus]
MFPRLKNHCSINQLQYWIGQAKIWGKSERSRKNQRKPGQNLWVVDEQLRAFVTDTSDSVKAYWKYLQHDTKHITIGYARKSPTDETKESRIRLLQLMVNKLYFRGKCEEVFVSPICKADQPILERDSPKQDDLLLNLKESHGDISDLIARVHFSQKPFRLVIIDYAGISTSPNDIRIFLEQCSNIKEVVVYHGSSFEILSRFDLLKNNDLEKFKCRNFSRWSTYDDEFEVTLYRRFTALLNVLFDLSDIIMVDGESVSKATKAAIDLNKTIFTLSEQSPSYGWKIDLILKYFNGKKGVEVSSNEWKHMGVGADLKIKQQCKNLRTNACILHQLNVNCHSNFTEVLAMDFIGNIGYLYL